MDHDTKRILAMIETALHNLHLAKMAMQGMNKIEQESATTILPLIWDLRSTLDWIDADLNKPTKDN